MADKGLDILLTLGKNEKKKTLGNRGKGVTITFAENATQSGDTARRAEAVLKLAGYFQSTPSSLPESLTAMPLFKRQGISDSGFGMSPEQFPGCDGHLNTFRVNDTITRKTMLPTVLACFK